MKQFIFLSMFFVLFVFSCTMAPKKDQSTSPTNPAVVVATPAPPASELESLKNELTKVETDLAAANDSLTKAEAQLQMTPKTVDVRLNKKRNLVENEVKQYQFIRSNLLLKKNHLESQIRMIEQADIQPK